MEANTIVFEIKYKLSEQYRAQQFKQTGKRPEEKQTLEVPSTELSPTAREKLLALPGGGSHREKVTKTRKLALPKHEIKTRRMVARYPTSSIEGRLYLDDYPTYSDASKGTWPPLVTVDAPLTADTVGEALEKRERRTEEIRTEYEEARDEAGTRLVELLSANIGHDGEGVPSAAPVLKSGILSDFEDTRHVEDLKALKEEAEAQNKRRREIKERRKQEQKEKKRRARERRAAEKMEWIGKHGSDVLQDAIEEGYDCQRRYAIERVQKEHHENFYLDFDGTSEYKERSCPSEEALRFAQETDGEVVWLVQPGTMVEDEEPSRGFQPTEAVRKRVSLGKHGRSYTLLREF